jgi:2-hydroxycyclohexanecarboxyl-CoA dehydrogenase
VRDGLGPIEILVTSAAVAGFTRFDKITLDQWNRYLAVNLTGTFLCLQAALADMASANWGRVVTISSAAGQQGAIGQGHYSATKGGVIALTKAVAQEYASRGIAINTVPPFIVDSPMLREQQRTQKLPPADILTKAIPAGRLGTGDDIAALVAFLCSDESGYVTGQVIGVNGGAVL